MPEENTPANVKNNASPILSGNTPPETWLVEEFSQRLAGVFESLAGERPPVESAFAEAPPVADSAFVWRQPFSVLTGALWTAAAEADWTAAGMHILRAAGLGAEDCDTDTTRSSYTEALNQALSGLAQELTGRLRREVTPVDGKQMVALPAEANRETGAAASRIDWRRLEFVMAGQTFALYAGVEPALAAAIERENAASENADAATENIETEKAGGRERNHQITRAAAAGGGSAGDRSQKFDLLLDVELPISVSFGTAEVPLKDVLKLTTGSIVELNRTILEPVEVVVNNCVIARGEVVVIEGNFGVRIKQVISRQDRIRTLR